MQILFVWIILGLISVSSCDRNETPTIAEIKGDDFYINGKITYEGITWKGIEMEGLLLNSRMVQGIFDDQNPETRDMFIYPDTHEWDAERNTNEFMTAMEDWYEHGLLAFTLNLQGGSPTGYGNKDWRNSAFDEKGSLRADYLDRLKKILNKADDLGMVVILGYFYFGQDQYLENEEAIIAAVTNITEWLLDQEYHHVLVEINNECNIRYDHKILQPDRVHELINLVKGKSRHGHRLYVSTSYGGGQIPEPRVVRSSDFLLLHGNGVDDPDGITRMIEETRNTEGFSEKPILFNEDDHYDFDKPVNNFVNAVKAHVSWGFFDYRRDGEAYEEGFQSVPVDWKIESDRKSQFFNLMKEMTSEKQ